MARRILAPRAYSRAAERNDLERQADALLRRDGQWRKHQQPVTSKPFEYRKPVGLPMSKKKRAAQRARQQQPIVPTALALPQSYWDSIERHRSNPSPDCPF